MSPLPFWAKKENTGKCFSNTKSPFTFCNLVEIEQVLILTNLFETDL